MKTIKILLTSTLCLLFYTQSNAQCVAAIELDGELNENLTVCSGTTVEFTVVVDDSDPDCNTNQGCFNNIEWTINGVESVANNNRDITLTETTTVSVLLGGNCDGLTAEVTVTVTPPLDLDIVLASNSAALCEGNNIDLELTGLPTDFEGIVDWFGSGVAQTDIGTTSIDDIGSDFTVSATYTDEFGCESSTGDVDFETTEPSANIQVTNAMGNSQSVFCEGESFTIALNPAENNVSCEWEVLSSGFTPNGDNCSVTVNSADQDDHDGVWEVIVTDENGCTNTNDIDILVNLAPNVSIQMETSQVCETAQEVEMTVSPSNGAYSSGSGCDTWDSNPIDVIDAEFDPGESGPGDFCVCYTYEENGCESEDCADITVFEPVAASFTGNIPATCKFGPTIDLGNYVSPAPNQGQGGDFLVNGCYDEENLDPADLCLDEGSNTVVYSYTDGNGCPSTASSNIQIWPELIATAEDGFDLCEGAEADLGVSTTGGNPNTYSFSWSPSAGLDGASTNSPTVISADVTETYVVTVTDENGCESNSQMTLNVFDTPEVTNILQDPVSFCVGGSVTLNLETNYNSDEWSIDSEYNWIFDGNSIQSDEPSNFFDVVNDTIQVTIQIGFDANGYDPGCENVFTNFTLNPVADPQPVLTSEQTELCIGEQAIFTASNVTQGTAFDWNFDPAPSSSEIIGNGNVIIASWDTATDVDVSVTESLVSCFGNDAISVTVSNSSAPSAAPIELFGTNVLVYTDASPDCYQWGFVDDDGDILFIQGATNQTLLLEEFNQGFIYFCQAWSGSCADQACSTTSFYDEAFVGIENATTSPSFLLYPNPGNGQCWIELPYGSTTGLRFEVSNTLGQTVDAGALASSAMSNRAFLDLSHLPSDLYVVSLFEGMNRLGTSRIIINR